MPEPQDINDAQYFYLSIFSYSLFSWAQLGELQLFLFFVFLCENDKPWRIEKLQKNRRFTKTCSLDAT